ncbi:Panacea domain-containing protein [uncultured Trichococcus sp.]|uniref:Panacea domain-containing protein n=1 Tax=uncultured Trichococcus sp. TaxID=189665 RepID=UPI00259311F2|nr:type II toxin-antitoxin system antitoxin SocA domain-containing protein [uncultured Trichococcus sp.]
MKNEPNCALMEMAFRKGDIIMTKLRQLARYLVYSYENHTAARFGDNELKLQTMLYFAQRECLALVGEPLFDGNFENWAEGPVLPELHFFFVEGYDPFEPLEMKKLTEREQFILDRVVLSYGQYEGWYLADLARRETSWRNSRSDPAAESAEPKLLEIADMREDAKKVRLYDPLFDVYLDEFEEFEGEVLKS